VIIGTSALMLMAMLGAVAAAFLHRTTLEEGKAHTFIAQPYRSSFKALHAC